MLYFLPCSDWLLWIFLRKSDQSCDCMVTWANQHFNLFNYKCTSLKFNSYSIAHTYLKKLNNTDHWIYMYSIHFTRWPNWFTIILIDKLTITWGLVRICSSSWHTVMYSWGHLFISLWTLTQMQKYTLYLIHL